LGIRSVKISMKLKVALILILLGFLFRTVFHLGENIEFVTSAALLSGSFLGPFWAVTVPLVIMAVSDFFIGNTMIYLFTWSAYLIIGLMGFLLLRKKKGKISHIIKAGFTGIVSSLIFFLWTNFGVWFLDSFGMYEKSFNGLLSAYIYGLPFLKSNLTGNLFFVPLSFAVFHFIPELYLAYSDLLSKKFSLGKTRK